MYRMESTLPFLRIFAFGVVGAVFSFEIMRRDNEMSVMIATKKKKVLNDQAHHPEKWS